jgi:hypothetical protein
MKTVRANFSGTVQRPFFKPGEIDRTCTQELKSAGLYPEQPEPIRIDRFLEKRFGISHTYDDLPAGLLGFTLFGSKGVVEIVVANALDDEDHEPTRRRLRTTLAHEGGHGLLHAYLFALGDSASLFGEGNAEGPKVLCRDVSGVSPDSSPKSAWSEYQANQAIGGLLLPNALVMKALEPFLSSEGLLGNPILRAAHRADAEQHIATVFDVNPVVARYRLAEMFASSNAGQASL